MMSRRPKINDLFYDARKIDQKKNPYGKIVRIFYEDEVVLVRFNGASIEWEQSTMVEAPYPRNGQVVCRFSMIRIDGILHHHNSFSNCITMTYEGGDTQTYYFDNLDGCWESSDGGEGCWKLEED